MKRVTLYVDMPCVCNKVVELHNTCSPWARSQKDEVAFHPREDTHFFLRNVRGIHLKHFFTCPPSRMLVAFAYFLVLTASTLCTLRADSVF